MKMRRNGDEIPALLPRDELYARLTELAACDDPEKVDHAFWAEEHSLVSACRDGMEALISLAALEKIGWEMNAGYRCDIAFQQFSVSVCDNGGGRRDVQFGELKAHTAQGALAAGILAILQAREEHP